jgi:hypothetical protein
MFLKQDLIILHGLLFILDEILIGWKKFATLLPNNWLAETPQTLASRRLGRQSAERERISEINWNVFKIKKYSQTDFFSSLTIVWRGVEWPHPEPYRDEAKKLLILY